MLRKRQTALLYRIKEGMGMEAGKRKQDYILHRKKVLQRVEHKRTFGKNFFRLSVSMLLVLFISFGVLYQTVKNIIIEQNIKISQQEFEQAQSQFEYASSAANMIATQVMLDDVCSEFLNAATDTGMNSITRNRVRNQLSMYENTNPAVESVYIYNKDIDMFITSGSRFGAVGKDSFTDREIVEILEKPENYNVRNLIPRERTSFYPNQVEKKEKLYTYMLFANRESKGNAVVVNLKLDNLIQTILQMDMMKDSILAIIDEEKQCLLNVRNGVISDEEELWETVDKFGGKQQEYGEYTINGQHVFVSCLYSEESGCWYVKATLYDTMFQTLILLQERALLFLGVVAAAVIFIALWNSLAILRLHRTLETKQISRKKTGNPHFYKEQFLTDFIHNRKVFSPVSLQAEMDKIDFAVKEGQTFTLVTLFLENYEKFKETFGKKGTYDIKFGFYNIFEETFREKFKVIGLINRDATMSFILEANERQMGEIGEVFQKFCRNSEVFIQWDFLLFGTGKAENLERIPERNSQISKVLGEGFFYPSNSYVTYSEIREEHSKNADFQKLDIGNLAKNLSSGKNVQENYRLLKEELKECTVTDYMNALIWFGISLIRGVKKYGISEEEGNEFLVNLSQCAKDVDADELFDAFFRKITCQQKECAVKKGVTGKMDEVKKYIENNFQNPNITLEMLGDAFHVSANYLGRMFKKEVGISVADYINNQRLECVMEQLEKTERPAKEIAENCGFVSTNYFYTFFKKKTGVTPQAYREMAVAGDNSLQE